MKDYYRILGVLDDAEDIIIRAAYKALAQRYHPDKWRGDSTEANKRMSDINEAYAILSKTMNEDSLRQVAAAITAKRTNLSPEEAKELALRAFKFKKERGRLPEMSSADAWEKRMAEGAAAFVRFKDEGRYD